MTNTPKTLFRIALVFLLWTCPIGAQQIDFGNGLEIEDYKEVQIVIEKLPTGAGEIGLKEDRIRTRIELRVRQAGLRPSKEPDEYLYVNVNISGGAFAVELAFNRLVTYQVSESRTLRTYAATWDADGVGRHGGDPEFIIESLDSLMDEFLNEYLGTNFQS